MKGRFWTGSKVVLGYITNNVQQLRTFFANGVEQIKDKLHQVNDTTFQLKNSCRWRIIRIECWSVEFWQSLVLRSFFFWPSRDVNAELSNDEPDLNEDTTSCSTLLSWRHYSKFGKQIFKLVDVKKGHCIGFALYEKVAWIS